MSLAEKIPLFRYFFRHKGFYLCLTLNTRTE